MPQNKNNVSLTKHTSLLEKNVNFENASQILSLLPLPDQLSFGSVNSTLRIATQRHACEKCKQEFGFAPSRSNSNEIYQLIKRLSSDSLAKDPVYKQGQYKRIIALLEDLLRQESHKHNSGVLYYLAKAYIESDIDSKKGFTLLMQVANSEDNTRFKRHAAFVFGVIYLEKAVSKSLRFIYDFPSTQIESMRAAFALQSNVQASNMLACAREYLERAYHSEDPSTITQLAKTYLLSDSEINYPKAIALLESAADQNDAEAAYILACIYKNGIKPANSGDITTSNSALPTGFIEYNNMKIPLQDMDKAARYLQQAVDKGYPEALREMGLAYYYGDRYGIHQDATQAEKYLIGATKRGDDKALNILCNAYNTGRRGCIPQDLNKYEIFANFRNEQKPTGKTAYYNDKHALATRNIINNKNIMLNNANNNSNNLPAGLQTPARTLLKGYAFSITCKDLLFEELKYYIRVQKEILFALLPKNKPSKEKSNTIRLSP